MMKANTTTTVCGHCGFLDRQILHHVRLGGNFRRLCTTCVLRLHSQYFCPSCFIVFDRSPPENASVCSKCFSSAHRTCVPPSVSGPTSSSRTPSPCATCLNPSRLVFDPKRGDAKRGIDTTAARLLVAAAEISSLSMSKAEVLAVSEAERRGKEASYTRKRAREALDHVVYLMEIEKKNNINGNKGVAMPVMDDRINNNKVVPANQIKNSYPMIINSSTGFWWIQCFHSISTDLDPYNFSKSSKVNESVEV
ncbi:hypothetical protein LXL04_001239 [Taraxacum kok-saghyz]